MDRHCLDILTLTFFALCMTSLSSTQGFNDPMYASQAWYLTKSGNESMNIVTAWNAGYTGEGVVVSVVDTGIEKNNDELKANYDQDASYDFVGNITDPIPGAGQTGAHGTRVAGIIAGSANNSKCGVGIAYNVKIGGIKFIDPILSTLGQGVGVAQKKALAFKRNYIDIYTCAWGPDGKTVEVSAIIYHQKFLKTIQNTVEMVKETSTFLQQAMKETLFFVTRVLTMVTSLLFIPLPLVLLIVMEQFHNQWRNVPPSQLLFIQEIIYNQKAQEIK